MGKLRFTALLLSVVMGSATAAAQQKIYHAWTALEGGYLPRDAFDLADKGGGQGLYVCVASFRERLQLGRLSGRECLFAHKGNAFRIREHHVMVVKPRHRTNLYWRQMRDRRLPKRAISMGSDAEGTAYLCRTVADKALYIGKVVEGECSFAYRGREYRARDFQVLIEDRNQNQRAADRAGQGDPGGSGGGTGGGSGGGGGGLGRLGKR